MAQPLKIAVLSRWYWEENRRSGGDGGTFQQLTEAVAALGHEVIVLSQSPKVTRLEKSRLGSLEVWLAPRDKRRAGWTSLRDKLAKFSFGHRKVYSDALDLGDFLKARGPFDLLWAQSEEPDGLVAATAKKIGVSLPPLIILICALRFHWVKNRPVFSGQKALGTAFQAADKILANSELVREDLHHYGCFQAKTEVLFPNLTRDFLAAASAEEVPPEKNRILFLGALNRNKGVLDFLAALPSLMLQQASYGIVGDFTEQNPAFLSEWKEQLALTQKEIDCQGHRLELMGKLPPEAVRREIQRAQLVVAPSHYDAFSRVVIEALALGRPVVTTETTGAAACVTHNKAGRVVPAGDPVALAQAMESAISPEAPDFAQARAAAGEVRKRFSPEAVAQDFLLKVQMYLQGSART